MHIDVTPEEYRLIQDLRKTRPPGTDAEPEALKPLRGVIDLDYHSQDWRGSASEPNAPNDKGSNTITVWDEDNHALIARWRDRARNSDAALRIQILRGAPQNTLLQMLDKLRIVIETDWEHLVYGSNREARDKGWYPVLPRPHGDGE